MSQITHFQNISQFPANFSGPGGEHGSIGIHTIAFQGSTGLVATSYGIPGMGATRQSTGAYNLFFPKTKSIHILPSLNAPSGYHMEANVSDVGASSGTAKLQVSRLQSFGSPASMVAMPFNPPTGTKIELLVINQPIRGY